MAQSAPMRPVVAAVLLLCLCGCSKVRTVDGELFLTGKDGRAVSLAGIEVAAYDLELCWAAVMAQSDTLSKQRNEAVKLYQKVSQLTDRLSSQAKKADAARKSPGPDQARAEAAQQEASERERHGMELRKSTELLVGWLMSVAPYFQHLPDRLGESAKTDSAGRFAFSIPKDRNVVAVAVVESSATGELETHFWIVKVASYENHITLSDKNRTAAKPTGSSGLGDSLLGGSRPLKASVAGINIPELRASIERDLEELSKTSASFPLN